MTIQPSSSKVIVRCSTTTSIFCLALTPAVCWCSVLSARCIQDPPTHLIYLSSSVVSFTQCSPTCGPMPLSTLSLWPGHQAYRPRPVGGRRGGLGHRLWLPAVVIHRLGVVEIAPSPHHCFRTAHPCAQSVKRSPTEPVLSRSSRQRLGHLQSHVDGGWHVCQAVFPEPQSAAARRRVERRDCAHEALPPLLS